MGPSFRVTIRCNSNCSLVPACSFILDSTLPSYHSLPGLANVCFLLFLHRSKLSFDFIPSNPSFSISRAHNDGLLRHAPVSNACVIVMFIVCPGPLATASVTTANHMKIAVAIVAIDYRRRTINIFSRSNLNKEVAGKQSGTCAEVAETNKHWCTQQK